MAFPNGTSTETVFRPDHTIQSRTTQGPNGEPLVAAGYEHNARDFVTKADENGRVSEFGYDAREQLNRVTTPAGDVILYEYDASGNRTVRKAIIQGAESNSQETIDIEQFMEMILAAMNGKAGKGNGNGNGNNGKGVGSCGGSTGTDNALERGQGKKLSLHKKLQDQWAGQLQPGQLQPGNIEHILAVIDNIVNGEVNLPPGEHEPLFKLVREVGAGYTIVGTTWTYNSKNEIATRSNLIRLEDYAYTYDQDGNLLSNK